MWRSAREDIALFTTKETVDHSFALAGVDAIEGETELRVMGYPRGLPLETMRQTAPVRFQDEVWYEIPVDRKSEGGFSGGPFFDTDGKLVGMLTGGDGNMVSAVKVEVIRKFLDGDLPWTACRDYPSVAACIERATTQVRELAQAGDRVAQYQLGTRRRPPRQGPRHAAPGRGGRICAGAGQRGFKVEEERRMGRGGPMVQGEAPSRGIRLARPSSRFVFQGQGVARDRVLAFRLMLETARSGDMVAQYNVGVMYERGAGTAADATKARHLAATGRRQGG